MAKRLLGVRNVCDKIGFCRSWLFEKVRKGEFPAPLALPGFGKNLWPEDLVDSWIDSKIEAGKKQSHEAA